MSKLEKKKFRNIINWMISMEDQNLFKTMDSLNQLDNLDQNINFFLKYKFNEENKIPDFIIKEQEDIKLKIKNNKNKVINFLAPTSFGKSKILLEIIKETDGNKMIICPTIALCNEYYIKIQENKILDIKVFTPEKANLFLIINPNFKFEVVVFDEFYEAVSRERRMSFTNCLKTVNELAKKIILISPYGAEISNFIESLKIYNKNEIFEISSSVSATSRIINLFEFDQNKKYIHKKYFQKTATEYISGFEVNEEVNKNNLDKAEWKHKIIFDNFGNEEEVIIYTSVANIIKFSNFLIKNSDIVNEINESFFVKIILEYLENNYPKMFLYDLIKRGYAYHHGKMDAFLRFMIEMAFQKKELKWILCTRTLSKGVNLDPRHLIIESTKRMPNEDNSSFSIEMQNMFGRTGRLTTNKYIGNLYLFLEKKGKKTNEIKNILNKNVKNEVIFEEIKKEIDKADYKSTSLYFEYNKNEIFLNWNLESKYIAILKKFLLREEKIDINDASDLDAFLINFFKIEWNKSFNNRISYIYYYFNNWNYSSIYKKELQNKLNENKINDELLSGIIDKYETSIGYHLKKILFLFAEIMFKKNIIIKDEYIKIIKSDYKIDENNFPDSFNKALASNLITEEKLNEIINKISKRDNNEK